MDETPSEQIKRQIEGTPTRPSSGLMRSAATTLSPSRPWRGPRAGRSTPRGTACPWSSHTEASAPTD